MTILPTIARDPSSLTLPIGYIASQSYPLTSYTVYGRTRTEAIATLIRACAIIS